MALRRTAVLALACLVWAATGPAAARLPDAAVRAIDRVSADDLHRYVETLAGDAFGGRGVGDPGNRAAEEFVCTTLRQNGVTPAGADGSCYQPIDVYRPALGERSSLRFTLTDGTSIGALAPGADYYPLPESGGADISAPLVFAGHGIVSPEQKYDDYRGVAARGAIVLVLDGAPPSLHGGDDTLSRKMANAAANGARGILLVSTTMADFHFVWPGDDTGRPPVFDLAAKLRRNIGAAMVSERAAQPVRRALAQGLAVTATLTPDVAGPTVTMRNVLGIVEGRDRARSGEMIVVGAHLDHDGTDAQGHVYNGADDNASGTAAVLAAAAAFARAAADGERPARPVLFALWNGEEKGSLGAEAFVSAPQPDRRVLANLNLDMVGRHEEIPDPRNWRFAGLPRVDVATSANTLHVLGYSYSPDLAAELRDANAGVGLTLLEDYDVGAQDLLRRSDHWPFVAHGIPALFLTTGLHPDYHTPDDDTARIDFDKLARVTRLAARAAWIVADGPPPGLKKR
jgi:hypothetical protein